MERGERKTQGGISSKDYALQTSRFLTAYCSLIYPAIVSKHQEAPLLQCLIASSCLSRSASRENSFTAFHWDDNQQGIRTRVDRFSHFERKSSNQSTHTHTLCFRAFKIITRLNKKITQAATYWPNDQTLKFFKHWKLKKKKNTWNANKKKKIKVLSTAKSRIESAFESSIVRPKFQKTPVSSSAIYYSAFHV